MRTVQKTKLLCLPSSESHQKLQEGFTSRNRLRLKTEAVTVLTVMTPITAKVRSRPFLALANAIKADGVHYNLMHMAGNLRHGLV